MSTETPPRPPSSPSMQVMQMLWPGALAVQAVHVAAALGLADLVAKAPQTAAELADATHTDKSSLGRLLRGLTSLGIFAVDTAGRYEQTQLSDVLRRDHPESIRPWGMMLGARFVWEPCGDLAETIKTGQPAFARILGAPFFPYLAGHPDDAAIFNAAMGSVPVHIAAVVDTYDFSNFARIVDVGGGRGALLRAILAANSQVRGVLFDLPGVVAGATAMQSEALADRFEIVSGDFFTAVPAGADAYLLSGIIHDWPDDAALTILNNCRRAIRADGTLLVVETVLTSSSDAAHALMDVLMMLLTGGRERTEPEFRSLLRNADFNLTRIISTPSVCILESRPV